MKKYLMLVCSIFLISSFRESGVNAAKQQQHSVQIAFEKDGFLWVEIDGRQEKITKESGKFPYPPQWSHDGKWVLYQKEIPATMDPSKEIENQLWVYNVETHKHKKIFYDGRNPKWAPNKNIFAFQSNGVLNISDLHDFHNITLGVDDYNWYPDGSAFIVSSAAALRPDGWTNPVLYKVSIPVNLKSTNLTDGQPLYVVPKELNKGATDILSINVGSFEFSPDGKWISFIVSPTASWSMDSNFLCVLSADSKDLEILDEIILHLESPQWAQTKNRIGYIAGGGRIVFGFKNKQMKVTELPTFKTLNLTPSHFAELGFTWIGNDEVIVSRVKEAEWSNDPKKRPKPALYSIQLNDRTQAKITNPKGEVGDVQPQYLPATNQITWLRKKETETNGDLWIATPNGKNSKRWLKNIGVYAIYPTH